MYSCQTKFSIHTVCGSTMPGMTLNLAIDEVSDIHWGRVELGPNGVDGAIIHPEIN